MWQNLIMKHVLLFVILICLPILSDDVFFKCQPETAEGLGELQLHINLEKGTINSPQNPDTEPEQFEETPSGYIKWSHTNYETGEWYNYSLNRVDLRLFMTYKQKGNYYREFFDCKKIKTKI